METWQIVVPAVGAVLVPALVMLQRRANRMKEASVGAVLTAQGWTRTDGDPSLVQRWGGEPFGEGEHQRVSNVFHGNQRGHQFVAFDYRYLMWSGRMHREHLFAVFAVDLPAALPDLQLSPEGLGDRLRAAAGQPDLSTGDVEFDERYHVACPDSRYARQVLTPELRRRLVDAPGRRSFRIEGRTLLMWEFGTLETYLFDAHRLVALVDLVARLVDALPEDVLRTYGVPSTGGEAGRRRT